MKPYEREFNLFLSHTRLSYLLSRVARKLWRFIKLLENEDDSLYRSRLLILVWIQFPPSRVKRGSFIVS